MDLQAAACGVEGDFLGGAVVGDVYFLDLDLSIVHAGLDAVCLEDVGGGGELSGQGGAEQQRSCSGERIEPHGGGEALRGQRLE